MGSLTPYLNQGMALVINLSAALVLFFVGRLLARRMAGLLLFFFFLGVPCQANGIGYQGTHILTYRTMSGLARAFTEKTGVTVAIRGGGCADGVAAVRDKTMELGGMCCPPRKNELESLGLVAHAVARDIKVAVVNEVNPLRSITTRQLMDLHQGKITSWRELGWRDKPVALVFRVHCQDRDEPVRQYLGIQSDISNLTPKRIIVRTDQELLDRVSSFPTAIGITSRVFAGERRVKVLKLDGVIPSPEMVSRGSYPFTAPMFLVTDQKPVPDTVRFLEFVLGAAGQSIVMRNLGPKP